MKKLNILINLKINDKVISGSLDKDNVLSWSSKEDGNVLVVYQISEKNQNGVEYNARSFEDAFFHINQKFFTELGGCTTKENIELCKLKFQGLKNIEDLFDEKLDSYALASKCVKKKPSLAMDILLNSESKDQKDFANWKIPQYIKEGLEWLQK